MATTFDAFSFKDALARLTGTANRHLDPVATEAARTAREASLVAEWQSSPNFALWTLGDLRAKAARTAADEQRASRAATVKQITQEAAGLRTDLEAKRRWLQRVEATPVLTKAEQDLLTTNDRITVLESRLTRSAVARLAAIFGAQHADVDARLGQLQRARDRGDRDAEAYLDEELGRALTAPIEDPVDRQRQAAHLARLEELRDARIGEADRHALHDLQSELDAITTRVSHADITARVEAGDTSVENVAALFRRTREQRAAEHGVEPAAV